MRWTLCAECYDWVCANTDTTRMFRDSCYIKTPHDHLLDKEFRPQF
jgi:hypothetical protein